jgi:DNA-binding TFAR19-related protein (PDSD5 family)
MGERWDEFEMEEIRNRRMADLRKQVGQLTAKAAQLEQRAKVLETRVTALEHVVADLIERLRALEHGEMEA